jgi:hypothetical protein
METGAQSKISEEYTKANMVEDEVQSELVKGMPLKFYPTQWLAFVTMGKPAGKTALNSFNGGKGKKKEPQGFNLSDLVGLRDSFGKSSRKVVDKVLDSGSSANGGRNEVITIMHRGLGNDDKIEQDRTIELTDLQIKTKREHILLFSEMIECGGDESGQLKAKKLILMNEISSLYEAKEKRLSSIANSSSVMIDLGFDTPVPPANGGQFPMVGEQVNA